MKTDEIREMTIDQLHARLEELRVDLFNLRFQKSKNLLDRVDSCAKLAGKSPASTPSSKKKSKRQ